MTSRTSNVVVFLAGATMGAAIWAAAPMIVGQREPWDADAGLSFLYYPVALMIAGLTCGFIVPKRPYVTYAGVVAGQLAYMFAFLPVGPLIVLGVIYLAAFSLMAIVGVLLAQLATVLLFRG